MRNIYEWEGDPAKLREPTSEECSAHALIDATADWRAYAIWYPQMGGYVARAIVGMHTSADGCFDMLIWHDGQFPFDNDDGPPCVVHHCMAEQFVTFGTTVLELLQRRG